MTCSNCCGPNACKWLLAVDELPSIVDADANHAYITPDNRVYVLSYDRSKMIQIGGK
ncbi:hypothetical protein [Streptococcus hyointestinalis]|nr:hypothetical protein [Streptococcus hyointestinalis]